MTLQELKQEIKKAKRAYDFPAEHAVGADIVLAVKPDTFEVVISRKGDKLLMPVAQCYPFLYRGQEKEYDASYCWPTLYRNNPYAADIFIERMRMMQFAELIDSHPIVEKFLKRHGFFIDYEGLAQHYGFRTSVMDFTDRVDIALFFAMCPYNDGAYHYHNDGQEHSAILYIIRPSIDYCDFIRHEFSELLNPIGMHPFSRPRRQRGFSVHIPTDDIFRPIKVDFTFTCEESKEYFDMFNSGNSIFTDDEFSAKAPQIIGNTHFSYKLFNRTFERYKPKSHSKTKLKAELTAKGIILAKEMDKILFSEDEKQDFITKWNEVDSKDVQQKITRKLWFEEVIDGVCKGRHEFRTQTVIYEQELIRTMFAADATRTYCPGLYVRYNEPAVPKKKKKIETGWKKSEAQMFSPVAKPFLRDEDMVIA